MSKTTGMEGNSPATANEHDDEKQKHAVGRDAKSKAANEHDDETQEHAVGMDAKSKAVISFPTVEEVMQMKVPELKSVILQHPHLTTLGTKQSLQKIDHYY
jgi:hypothetical protein